MDGVVLVSSVKNTPIFPSKVEVRIFVGDYGNCSALRGMMMFVFKVGDEAVRDAESARADNGSCAHRDDGLHRWSHRRAALERAGTCLSGGGVLH